ncbi:hypothetical protein QVZ41_13940 [Wenyingzhuangia sp. chi5]|uniref:Uncharacterized protein n=1 Tax=Wenyingzhuangia gilva TaxID=3057677 RepID=A0ABT8VVF0_9FLAO|nr:hypothetical protein [Wenyingzhuangia sp. chi5]MDO3695948.1 hypothetical protein [Wenyingzhuangia sp. chi5]
MLIWLREIKRNKIKGDSLFKLGYAAIHFKDTSDIFSYRIKYPKNIKNLKRFQLKVDFKENEEYNVELLLGNKNEKQIFIIDENNNKDLTDDSIRICEKINWNSPPKIVKCKFLISDNNQIVKDSSWLCIGNSKGKILLGKKEHLVGKFRIDKENYEVGIVEHNNPMSFTYGFKTKIALLSNLGIKKDSISYGELMTFGEVLNLNNKYYRFEKISNNGEFITLVKDKNYKTKIGTQKGMIAPSYKVITISGDTITSSKSQNKPTIIVNSCGCGGDKKSTEAFYELERRFGKSINILHVDSNIEKSNIGIHIDSENEYNKDFYNNYRKQYCSRICYIIGKNNRIIDKFDIILNDWKSIIPKVIN